MNKSKIIKQHRWRQFIERKTNAMIKTRSKPIHDLRRVRKESCPMDAEVNNHSRWEENIYHHLCSVIQMMRKAKVTRSAQCRNSSSYQSCFPKCSNHDIRFSVKDYQHLVVHCFVFDQRQIAIFKQFGR